MFQNKNNLFGEILYLLHLLALVFVATYTIKNFVVYSNMVDWLNRKLLYTVTSSKK